jgi:hypothetical protein
MLQEAIQAAYQHNEARIRDALKLERPAIDEQARRRLDDFKIWAGKQGVRYLPAVPAVIAAYIETIPENEISDALGSIQLAHDYVGASSPVGSLAVRTVLARRLNISPPRSWRNDEKLVFMELPVEVREVIARREREDGAAVRRLQNQLAELRNRPQGHTEEGTKNEED